MLAPNLYQDVDGRYRGMDLNIHQTKDFEYYTVFSLWDTYRAAHPLYTIIEQERTNDFINTFLAKYDEGGIMPIWDLAGKLYGLYDRLSCGASYCRCLSERNSKL